MLRRKWLWMASLPVLILILELLVGKAPGWKGLGLLLFGVILYASGEWDSCAPNVCHEKSSKRTNASVRRMLSRAAVCIIAGILLWTGAGWFQKPVNAILKKSPEMLQFQHDLEQRISSVKLPFFKNKVSITNQRPKYQDKEVLQVESTKEVDGNLYFRNFYGTDYENGSWRCDMADYAQAAQKADSLPQETAFELAGRLYWAAEQDQTDYTITYTDGWGSDACIPYFTDLEHAKGISVVDDGRAKKGFFKKTTSISGRNNNTDLYRFLMNRIYQEEEEDAKLEWYDQYAKRFVEEPNDTKLADILFGYQIDAGFYRGMYQTGSAQDRNENRLILASLVSELLDERCSYSLNLSDIPEGEDAVEYFLSKNREGYCMHFASAGALVLRECGIPARYASGYIVKAKDFKKNADGGYTASVKDRNAHAWVEIYLDGIGWVPIEMTPGFGTKESKLPTETKDKPAGQTQNENENDSDSETETQTETESESETEELPENETEQKPAHMSQTTAQTASAAKTALKFLGLAAAVLLLAGLLFWQGKRALRRFRMQIEKDLKRKNYKRAVKRMNRRLYRKLLYTGKIRKQNLTDREYERVLAKSYPQISEADWAGFMRIAKEAAFSAHEISREDAEFCYRLYRRCRILKEK